jgi:hypothetical protein
MSKPREELGGHRGQESLGKGARANVGCATLCDDWQAVEELSHRPPTRNMPTERDIPFSFTSHHAADLIGIPYGIHDVLGFSGIPDEKEIRCVSPQGQV